MFRAEAKILEPRGLGPWRREQRRKGLRVVATNGCFDLLHSGHVRYLEAARNLGDLLLVGLNGDQSVRTLKGPGRPVRQERDRALVLASLGCVDAVCVFAETRARRFLSEAAPDIYAKGGDYSLDSLDPGEREQVESQGGLIRMLPLVEGESTTSLIRKLQSGGQ